MTYCEPHINEKPCTLCKYETTIEDHRLLLIRNASLELETTGLREAVERYKRAAKPQRPPS